MEGQESISSVLGPMTNSLEGVKLFTKAIIDARPWRKDPLAVRKEWSAREYALGDHGEGGKMCFAIMWDNGLVKPHPPLVRAMEIAKKALEAAGHTGKTATHHLVASIRLTCVVIDWENHRHLEIFENGVSATIFPASARNTHRCRARIA